MDLHERLIKLQSTDELKRKSDKSRTKARVYTQENIDYIYRQAKELSKKFKSIFEAKPWLN